MRQILLSLVFTVLASVAISEAAIDTLVTNIDTTNKGTRPESVLVDRTNGNLYVSLQNDISVATDGIIAVYDLSNYIIKTAFACNSNTLRDPMGMALIGNYLYVANSDLSSVSGGNIVRINTSDGSCSSALDLAAGGRTITISPRTELPSGRVRGSPRPPATFTILRIFPAGPPLPRISTHL